MPIYGDWQTQPTQTGLTATLYDGDDRPIIENRLYRQDFNSQDPGSSVYNYDPTLSFSKVTHDTVPTYGGINSFNAGFASVAGIREPWRGGIAAYVVSMTWLGIPFDLVFQNQLPSGYPPDFDWETSNIEFEFPPGSGQAAVFGDVSTQLYESAGVHNLNVVMEGLIAPYTPASGQPYHHFPSALEVRLGSVAPVAGSSNLGSSWQTPEQLQIKDPLVSEALPVFDEPVYDPVDQFWVQPVAVDFPVQFNIPESAIPRRYADRAENYIELIFTIDNHVNDVQPSLAPMAQEPTWPYGEDELHEAYVWAETWQAAVEYGHNIPDQFGPDGRYHYNIRAIYTFTFDWTPPRYRYVYPDPVPDLDAEAKWGRLAFMKPMGS